ncbi:hypothetical protein [Chroococcidiopsis sp.]|uniref:hypothetical protein n=1 Tax=Chroococcidiopsis sp. TaxID=3088168 RepID=UPI003F67C50B
MYIQTPPLAEPSILSASASWKYKYGTSFVDELYRKVPIRSMHRTTVFLVGPDRSYYSYCSSQATLLSFFNYGAAAEAARQPLSSFKPIYHVVTPTLHEHLCDREFLISAFLPTKMAAEDFFDQSSCGPLGLGTYSTISLNEAVQIAIVKQIY